MNMPDLPLISVLTPSYNQAAYLPLTLQSVAGQTYPAWEHIIVDGGSQDGSPGILADHADRYPGQVRWISEPDRGQADAMNKAFGIAQGVILGWLNSDDTYLTRTVLEEAAALLAAHPEVDVLYGDAVLVDADNRLLRVLHHPAYSPGHMLRVCRITQPAVFLRRRVLAAEPLNVEVGIALDYEYWLRLGQAGYCFRHVPRLWAVDRNHPTRKILAQREALAAERRALQRCYGGRPNLTASLWDKLALGLPTRLRGAFSLLRLYRLPAQELALPLRRDAWYAALWRQLFKRNRELV
jgi:glycosyltransferase involved in cell wall biosynthesis